MKQVIERQVRCVGVHSTLETWIVEFTDIASHRISGGPQVRTLEIVGVFQDQYKPGQIYSVEISTIPLPQPA
jgi:hypothetical protein